MFGTHVILLGALTTWLTPLWLFGLGITLGLVLLGAVWGVLAPDDVLWVVGERYGRETPLHLHAAALRGLGPIAWYADPSGRTEIEVISRFESVYRPRGDRDIAAAAAEVIGDDDTIRFIPTGRVFIPPDDTMFTSDLEGVPFSGAMPSDNVYVVEGLHGGSEDGEPAAEDEPAGAGTGEVVRIIDTPELPSATDPAW